MNQPSFCSVSPPSMSVVPIWSYCNDVQLAIGTAFFWRWMGQPWLVTNWHNLSGRKPETGQPVDSRHGAVPDWMQMLLHRRGGALPWVGPVKVMLNDSNGAPRWAMHPRGQAVDVAAMRIDPPPEAELHCLNDHPLVEDPDVLVGNDVFLLGFPAGLLPTGILPVWKRGSVATEPEMDAKNLPCIWVDATTRPGMSGSPAIVRSFPKVREDNKIYLSPGNAFLGVY